jgi:hypothetical protein
MYLNGLKSVGVNLLTGANKNKLGALSVVVLSNNIHNVDT